MDVYVFLFTDLLLITKAKKGDKFKVIKPVSESYLYHYSGSADVFKNGRGIELGEGGFASVDASFLMGNDG